ncbi:MAG: glycerol-3-phosphate dehydrogenase/oxidase [Actinobacteria bacterium]|nr:glycerol-3-phosphate dehydrogenase/oxidase [Actinomycetota bacterium]
MGFVSRADALEQLAAREFDLLVIGGGIIGAGIACEGARAGLAVALVDRLDFGSATSSASSKLIHGGLRYLRLGDIRLVREAHEERRLLLKVIAPHLVQPLRFLLPLYEHGPYRPLALRAGLLLYSTLARERFGGIVSAERARARVPDLRIDGLRGCGLYADAWTNDSRLCLANVRGAAEDGATVLNYAAVRSLRVVRGRIVGADVEDGIGGNNVSVQTRTVVNATGPWVDEVRRLEDPGCPRSSRLSKGVHVLVRPEHAWSAALTIPHDRVRVSFAVPWEGMLMLGTTDTAYDGDPADVRPTEEDIEQVLGEAAIALDTSLVERDRVRYAFAGLRVLPGTGRDTARARRETVLLRGPAGMLSVAGGKLTTYRRIAHNVLQALRAELGLHSIDTDARPLPGAGRVADIAAWLATEPTEIEPATRSHLARLYGTFAQDVLAEAEPNAELLRPLHPDGPDIAAQVAYARRAEWACSVDDVLRRRTTLAVRGLAEPAVVARVDELLHGDVRSAA